jgi:hypothetical protein
VSATLLGFLALLVIAGAAALWFRLALAVRLPKDRSGFIFVWVGGTLLGIAALSQGAGWAGGIPAGLAVLVGAFLLITAAIGPQQVAADAVAVGEPLRDFSAPDENGEIIGLASTAGRPVLLKFFRGHW